MPQQARKTDRGRSGIEFDLILQSYEMLGIPADADDTLVHGAYRRLAMRWHPDRNPGQYKIAEQKMARINAAYANIRQARGHKSNQAAHRLYRENGGKDMPSIRQSSTLLGRLRRWLYGSKTRRADKI